MRNHYFNYFLYLFLLAAFICSPVSAQEMRKLIFEESFEDFPNPERGFYHSRSLAEIQNFDIRGENLTLVYLRVIADKFRDKPLSEEFLHTVQNGFDEARKNGIKINPRVAYNYGPYPGAKARYGDDAPLDIVLTHISQLKPLWIKNKDVINVLDAGFIGGWGEWHTSANGLDSLPNRRAILFAILDALPKDRMVVQRYPGLKRAIFTGSETNDDSVLTRARAFDGSNLARIGHLNDCFLSSPIDVGTYRHTDEGWTVERELNYIGSESPFVPYGGETCRLDPRGECDNAVPEMTELHINYLNLDYNRRVLDRWKDQGCFDEIKRRIGYRFVLASVQMPEQIHPGGELNLEFNIRNVGFGELFNPRKVEIVLKNNTTGIEKVAVLKEEPRFWGAGKTTAVHATLSIPANLEKGEYTLGIRMPDLSPSIHDDPRYSIRFANKDIWDGTTGTNIVVKNLPVTEAAGGEKKSNYNKFEEIETM